MESAQTQFAIAPDGVRIAYEQRGAGTDIVLVHGFASSRAQNWKDAGWYEALTGAGFRILALDCRGHGMSGKPHSPEFYSHDRMAGDVALVMAAAGIARAFVLGYSMGGFIGLRLLARHPAGVAGLVLGGVGENYVGSGLPHPLTDPAEREAIAEALLAPDKNSIAHARGRMFREFADQRDKDRIALAACMRAMSPPLPRETLGGMKVPVLVICGEQDDVAGAPGPLAACFPDGQAVTVPRRNHMTAVGDKSVRDVVLRFLGALV